MTDERSIRTQSPDVQGVEPDRHVYIIVVLQESDGCMIESLTSQFKLLVGKRLVVGCVAVNDIYENQSAAVFSNYVY